MEVVVDAQIIGWYYQEHELEKAPPCTASPRGVIDRLGNGDIGVLDDGGQIEGEWRRQADPDWFDSWLAERFKVGDLIEIEIGNCEELLKELADKCGFPMTSGDKWHVRTARTRAEALSEAVAIISEDLDFFEPKAKSQSAKRRKKILRDCSGCVAKRLGKVDVKVRSVVAHCS